MSKIKVDYDDQSFWKQVHDLALQGYSNRQIALQIKLPDGERINPEYFRQLVEGTNSSWSTEDRTKYSLRATKILEEARQQINALCRARLLKCAIGGHKVKSHTVVRKRMQIDGEYTDNEIIQTSDTESEMAPNPALLMRWLQKYDDDWVENLDEDGDDTPARNGIDVASWLDKEMDDISAIKDNEENVGEGDGETSEGSENG